MAREDWQKAVEAHHALRQRISESEAWRANQARLNEAVDQWRQFFEGPDLTTAKELLLAVGKVLPLDWVDYATAEDGLEYALYVLTPTADLQKACFSSSAARQRVYRTHTLPAELSPNFALFTCSPSELLSFFRANNDPEAISKAFRSMVRQLDVFADQLMRESKRNLDELERVEAST